MYAGESSDGVRRIYICLTRDVPEGYEVVEYGFYRTNSDSTNQYEAEAYIWNNLGSDSVKNNYGTQPDRNDTYTLSLKTTGNEDRENYLIGYLKVLNVETGIQSMISTPMVTASYNSLIG